MADKRFVKYALLPAVLMMLLAIYPQISLWLTQGSSWQGAYVLTNYDEVAYSAYINALVNGRPRKNDPFLGKDDSAETPLNESLYSIQFVPAYSIALPARILGISTSTAFIFLILLMALFSALAVFWFLFELTRDELFSAAGTLCVLCLGTAAAFQGELKVWLDGDIVCAFFPFLRRYQPGFGFPLFFVFCILIWKCITGENARKHSLYAAGAGLMFALLVFSYFYLWTTALAWFGCLVLLWFVLRGEERARMLKLCGIFGVFAVAALIPYFIMLSQRSVNTDNVQLLTHSRMPILFAVPEIIGFLVVAGTLICARRGLIKLNSPEILFTLATALTPAIVMNQQIITGRSLQPIHYEIFITNYLVIVSFISLLAAVAKENLSDQKIVLIRRAVLYLGIFALIWGVIEAGSPTRNIAVGARFLDEIVPAFRT